MQLELLCSTCRNAYNAQIHDEPIDLSQKAGFDEMFRSDEYFIEITLTTALSHIIKEN